MQIQCLEGNHVFRWFRAILLNHREMKLVIDEPVIGHVENRAIFQEELRYVRSLFAVGIHGSLVHLRNIVCGTSGGGSDVTERPRPEEVTGRPPTGVQSPEWSAEKKGGVVKDEQRRKWANRTPGRAKTSGAECARRRSCQDSRSGNRCVNDRRRNRSVGNRWGRYMNYSSTSAAGGMLCQSQRGGDANRE